MTDDLKGAAAAVAECLDQTVCALPDGALMEQLTVIDQLQRRLTVFVLAILRELDGRNIARREGARSLVAWLRARFHMSVSTANRLVKLARVVDAELPATRDALADAAVNIEQAWVIKEALNRLPDTLDPELVAKAEAAMVAQAEHMDPSALRAVGARILHDVAPDEVAEGHERQASEEQSRDVWQRRRLTFTPDGNGAVRISALLDGETAALVQAGIDAIAEPRTGKHCNPRESAGSPGSFSPEGRSDSGELGDRGGLRSMSGAGDSANRSGAEDRDERDIAQRRADALPVVIRAAFAAEPLPDPVEDPSTAAVAVDHDVVSGQLEAGSLDNAEQSAPAVVRPAACEAPLVPGASGSPDQPIDLAIGRRLFGGAPPRTLTLGEAKCAVPRCGRPPKWCEDHRLVAAKGWPVSAPWHWLPDVRVTLSSHS